MCGVGSNCMPQSTAIIDVLPGLYGQLRRGRNARDVAERASMPIRELRGYHLSRGRPSPYWPRRSLHPLRKFEPRIWLLRMY